MTLEISDLVGEPGHLGYILYFTLANSCWYKASVFRNKPGLILIKTLGGQCDIRYGYLAYVNQ